MKLAFIGTGYVGLVSAACLAEVGNDVICVDKNANLIDHLKAGRISIYEPGLDELVKKEIAEQRLLFTTDMAYALKDVCICFITVGTPLGADGSADLSYVLEVAESIGKILDHPLVVVTKSTVPVGTTLRVKEMISDGLRKRGLDTSWIRIASNPEFLREGAAVNVFKKPDRVIVGVENGDKTVLDKLHELYSPFMRKSDRFIAMDIASAELTKYASNAMLAMRISFMNSMSRLSEKMGADIELIRKGMGTDPRIGSEFLFAGIGYGGSCFPKDVNALRHMSREYREILPLVEATKEVNDTQVKWFFNKIKRYFMDKGGLNGKLTAVWGAAFKANTDDIRESQSLKLIELFLDAGMEVRLHDPKALDNSKKIFKDGITYYEDMYQCVLGADLLVVGVDWLEFRSPDWEKIGARMKETVIFDGRNLYSGLEGVKYYDGVGNHCDVHND